MLGANGANGDRSDTEFVAGDQLDDGNETTPSDKASGA
jgi:hypothetical protein